MHATYLNLLQVLAFGACLSSLAQERSAAYEKQKQALLLKPIFKNTIVQLEKSGRKTLEPERLISPPEASKKPSEESNPADLEASTPRAKPIDAAAPFRNPNEVRDWSTAHSGTSTCSENNYLGKFCLFDGEANKVTLCADRYQRCVSANK